MNRRRIVASPRTCSAALVLCSLLTLGQTGSTQQVQSRGTALPAFEVDASWPKPLPNRWQLGPVSAVIVDSRDHIWILHRPGSLAAARKEGASGSATAECCTPAPPVIEFDQAGNLIQAWGGPGAGYEWSGEHGIFVDHKDNVWITGTGEKGNVLLKFSRAGKFLLQVGQAGKTGGSNDTRLFGATPASVTIDPVTNEVFVADGYQNRRVIVFDAETGAYKRHWGAYGNRPDDGAAAKYDPSAPPSQQFATPVHCVRIAKDGLVYVCDRVNDRLQVFQKNGTFVKEVAVAKETPSPGSVWDVAFSPDERFIYVPDGTNQKVWVLVRDRLEVVGSFGRAGKMPGEFVRFVHGIAVDSNGNTYTAEVNEGRRAQKFLYKGMGSR